MMRPRNEKNVAKVKGLLKTAFPDANIYHAQDFESDEHRFQIEDPKPRLWLTVSDDTIEDNTEEQLADLFHRFNVIDQLERAPDGARFFLKSSGLATKE